MSTPLPTATPPVLEVTAASKTYRAASRTVAAFTDVSFSVAPGEVVVLLGASGCGKSSLLKAIAGLQPVDTGELRVLGRSLHAPAPEVGLVFQQPVLLPWLDVAANVAFSLNLRHAPDLDRATRTARVTTALADVGLSHARHARADQLSGGMAQRVSLARALVREPALLLLDEPLGALDAITRLEMQRLLLKVIAAHHASALLVTHDLDEALLLADRIFLMTPNPGRIVAEWTVTTPQPRFERTLELAPLRAEILAALSGTFTAAA